jgi:hypothetical protein
MTNDERIEVKSAALYRFLEPSFAVRGGAEMSKFMEWIEIFWNARRQEYRHYGALMVCLQAKNVRFP